MTELYARLEAHKAGRIFYPVDLLQQFNPESLAVLFLIAMPLPLLGKGFGSSFLLDFRYHWRALLSLLKFLYL